MNRRAKKAPSGDNGVAYESTTSIAQNGACANGAMIDGNEETLLAALMNGMDVPVGTDHFFSQPRQEILCAIREVAADGHEPNVLSVTNRLRDKNRLEAVGGAVEITRISLMTISEAIVTYALSEILEYAHQRRGVEIGTALSKGSITVSDAVERLTELHEPRRDLPPIEDGSMLIAQQIVVPDEVIEGVLHLGGKMVLGGASKSCKTWTLVDTAVSVATGTPWLGQYATKRGRVLYINFEIPKPFFAKRIRTVRDARQIKIEPGFLHVWNLRGHAADLSVLMPRLLQKIGRDRYALIIIDPVYKLLGGRDENAASDIANLCNEIERLAVLTGAAAAFGAHYSKGNQSQKESIDRIGGSGVFARDPDTILNFTHHEEKDCFTVEATLRNHPPVESFVVRWDYPLMCIDPSLDPTDLKKVGAGRKPETSPDQVLDLLTEPMSEADWRTLAIKKLEISRRTFDRRRDELEAKGTVIFEDEKWHKK